MADKPEKTPAASPAEGAGTSTPDVAADTKDAQIAALQAQLAAAQAGAALSQMQAAQQPAPATFSPPSAPLIGKYDKLTDLVQQLPQKLWDQLCDEDKERFTDYSAEAPAKLATHE